MANPPIPHDRLKKIARDICQQVIGSVEFYDHSRTDEWNKNILNSMLKAVIAELYPSGTSQSPKYKVACNSTIVQHLVPTSALNRPRGGVDSASTAHTATSADASGAASTDGKPHVGRRGIHTAIQAFWDEKSDGIWTFRYEGDSKGMDVIITVIWMAI